MSTIIIQSMWTVKSSWSSLERERKYKKKIIPPFLTFILLALLELVCSISLQLVITFELDNLFHSVSCLQDYNLFTPSFPACTLSLCRNLFVGNIRFACGRTSESMHVKESLSQYHTVTHMWTLCYTLIKYILYISYNIIIRKSSFLLRTYNNPSLSLFRKDCLSKTTL